MEHKSTDENKDEQNILPETEIHSHDPEIGAPKGHKNLYMVLFILAFLLMGVTAVYYYFYGSVDYKSVFATDQKEMTKPQESSYQTDLGKNSGSLYLLCMGIDKTEERESWLGVYRTDTIVLTRIDLDKKRIKLLSIPRDTYTFVPVENKNDKINHAYAFGSLQNNGVQACIDAVHYLIGRNVVDYYFLMDMEPIPKIVDQIGGVMIDVEIDMKDHGANLSKGMQRLNGQQAFDYIHWRYSANGDIDRIKRQQKFARELYKQQRDKEGIIKTVQTVLTYRSSIETDLSSRQMIGLAKFLNEIPEGNVEYYYIPGGGAMINGISYWVMDQEETEKTLGEIFAK